MRPRPSRRLLPLLARLAVAVHDLLHGLSLVLATRPVRQPLPHILEALLSGPDLPDLSADQAPELGLVGAGPPGARLLVGLEAVGPRDRDRLLISILARLYDEFGRWITQIVCLGLDHHLAKSIAGPDRRRQRVAGYLVRFPSSTEAAGGLPATARPRVAVMRD